MSNRKKGNVLVFLTISIFAFIAMAVVIMILPVSSSVERIGKNYIDGSIAVGTMDSARMILDFSESEKQAISVSLNGYELTSFFEKGSWYVRIEDGHSTRLIKSERR